MGLKSISPFDDSDIEIVAYHICRCDGSGSDAHCKMRHAAKFYAPLVKRIMAVSAGVLAMLALPFEFQHKKLLAMDLLFANQPEPVLFRCHLCNIAIAFHLYLFIFIFVADTKIKSLKRLPLIRQQFRIHARWSRYALFLLVLFDTSCCHLCQIESRQRCNWWTKAHSRLAPLAFKSQYQNDHWMFVFRLGNLKRTKARKTNAQFQLPLKTAIVSVFIRCSFKECSKTNLLVTKQSYQKVRIFVCAVGQTHTFTIQLQKVW